MVKIGIIAEYNPLHNGHVLHFNEIKKLYPNSLTLGILSSEFSQRGELCVFNKFDRTKLGLNLGIDLVLSNPIVTSMQMASTFAYTNVTFLNMCKVDKIIIGSEVDSIDYLKKALKVMKSKDFIDKANSLHESGYSYKLAYTKTFSDFGLEIKSNDTLALFYLDAINHINPDIELETIKRQEANYLDNTENPSNIQSAFFLRDQAKIEKFVPKYTNDLFIKKGYRDQNKLTSFIQYRSLDFNKKLFEDSEGISNKFKDLYKYDNYTDMLEFLKSKRYSISKLRRLLASLLLEIEKKKYKIDFIRVLGFNSKGAKYLNQIKKEVTIYTNIKEGINYILDTEMKASKILDMIYKENLLSLEQQGPIITE